MKFSVLIPVYNTEKYLDECLKSVLEQTYQNFEIVLVDDGSTDNSGKICDRYQAEYPSVVKVIHQENQGQLASRCNAIKAATGDYCVFMDADDLITEDLLENLNNAQEKYNFPDMICYPFYYDRNGELEISKLIYEENRVIYNDEIFDFRKKFFSSTLLNSMWTKAVKTEILKTSIYDVDKFNKMRCAEDRLQSMWIMDNVKRVVYLNKPLYRYRLFEGSTTRQYSYKNIDKFNEVIIYDEQLKYADKWGFFTGDWKNEFDASVIRYMLYVFDLFYLNVESSEKKLVIDYPWKSFLPDGIEVEKSKYLNITLKKLYSYIMSKNYNAIKWHYFKKKVYKGTRRLKRKVLS